jgi:hypothetical protein
MKKVHENHCEKHQFVILKGSGKYTGVPIWKCMHCDKKVISS